MTIEVKQMVIKSTVDQNDNRSSAESDSENQQVNKSEILRECRQMMIELLEKRRER